MASHKGRLMFKKKKKQVVRSDLHSALKDRNQGKWVVLASRYHPCMRLKHVYLRCCFTAPRWYYLRYSN